MAGSGLFSTPADDEEIAGKRGEFSHRTDGIILPLTHSRWFEVTTAVVLFLQMLLTEYVETVAVEGRCMVFSGELEKDAWASSSPISAKQPNVIKLSIIHNVRYKTMSFVWFNSIVYMPYLYKI